MDSSSLLTLQAANFQQSQAEQTRVTAKTGDHAKLGLDFETMCLSNLLAPMFEGLSTDGPFGGGQGEEAMRSFYVGAMAKEMALRGGVGISNLMQAQLARQEQDQQSGVL
ncbi:MAG: rod-binding protein [Asticcacaulis sp.]